MGMLMIDEGLSPRLISFGAPKVGNFEYAQYSAKKWEKQIRVVNQNDLVTQVPAKKHGFEHVGKVVMKNGDTMSRPQSSDFGFAGHVILGADLIKELAEKNNANKEEAPSTD